jgi:hypothetical protein
MLLRMTLTGPAVALEDKSACMVPVPVTASLVRDARMFDLLGFAAEGAAPAFVAGWLSPTRDVVEAQADASGSVVFSRTADGAWRAFLPRPGEDIVGVYVAPTSSALIIVTMSHTEGPGASWTLLRSADALTSGACVTVEFPDTLDRGNEFLNLHDLDIAADGRGEIVGAAVTRDRGDLWFVYATRDGGATWSAPRRLPRERKASRGIYRKIAEAPAPEALVTDLARFAADR